MSALAVALLLATHYGRVSARARAALVRSLGQRGYLTTDSAITVAALAAVVATYRRAPVQVLCTTPDTVKMALVPLVALAFGLVVCGLTASNPTIVGAERLVDRPDCVPGVLRVTRNPFLEDAGT